MFQNCGCLRLRRQGLLLVENSKFVCWKPLFGMRHLHISALFSYSSQKQTPLQYEIEIFPFVFNVQYSNDMKNLFSITNRNYKAFIIRKRSVFPNVSCVILIVHYQNNMIFQCSSKGYNIRIKDNKSSYKYLFCVISINKTYVKDENVTFL